jgi:hypothetical protein
MAAIRGASRPKICRSSTQMPLSKSQPWAPPGLGVANHLPSTIIHHLFRYTPRADSRIGSSKKLSKNSRAGPIREKVWPISTGRGPVLPRAGLRHSEKAGGGPFAAGLAHPSVALFLAADMDGRSGSKSPCGRDCVRADGGGAALMWSARRITHPLSVTNTLISCCNLSSCCVMSRQFPSAIAISAGAPCRSCCGR